MQVRVMSSFRILKVKNEQSGLLINFRRDLSTLECAFFGRLISRFPEDERPQGWTLPPHPFPDDFRCAWSRG